MFVLAVNIVSGPLANDQVSHYLILSVSHVNLGLTEHATCILYRLGKFRIMYRNDGKGLVYY